jgi:branched-chain amino acid transport system substrate-binding protein
MPVQNPLDVAARFRQDHVDLARPRFRRPHSGHLEPRLRRSAVNRPFRFAGTIAVAASIALVACIPAASAQTAGTPVEIDAILSLTGGIANIGQAARQGLEAFERYTNATGGVRGRPLHIVYSDDESSTQVAVQLTNTLAARGARVILGPEVSAECKAVAPLVETRGPVVFCLSPAVAPAKGSYMFTGSIAPLDTLAAMLHFFRDRGWNRLALLHTIDATGQEHDTAMDKLLQQPENRSLKVVIEEHFAPSDVSVSAQVTRIRASDAQALIVSAVGSAFATAFRAISDAGLDMPVSATNSIMLYQAMREYKSFLPKRLYFASTSWPAYETMARGPVKDQLKHYYDAFAAAGLKPDNGEVTAWDPALIVVSALRTLGPDATQQQVRDYIESLHGFAGIDTVYDFRIGDQRGGLTAKDAVISQWSPARDTWVVVK